MITVTRIVGAEAGHVDHDHHHHGPADYGRAFAIGVSMLRWSWLRQSMECSPTRSRFWPMPRVPQRRTRSAVRLRCHHPAKRGAESSLHLWVMQVLDPRGPGQRCLPAARDRRDCLGSHPAVQQSPACCRHAVIIVAAIGIAVNTATALLFFSGRKSDVNTRGAFLHMAADAALWLGVGSRESASCTPVGCGSIP